MKKLEICCDASIMNEAKEKEKEVINNKLIDLIKNKE